MSISGRRRPVLAGLAAAVTVGMLVLGGPTARGAGSATPVSIPGSDNGDFEPNIAIAPDGTIYVNAPPGLPGRSDVYRSDDGGATWTSSLLEGRPDGFGGGDADLAVSPTRASTGVPYDIFLTDLWLGDATVSSSTNEGANWTSNPVQGAPLQDRPWIAATGNGVVYHLTNQAVAGLIVSKSTDGGATFLSSSLVAPNTEVVAISDPALTTCSCGAPGPLFATPGPSGDGTDDVVGFTFQNGAGGLEFAYSSDGASTWSYSEIAQSGVSFDSFPVVKSTGGANPILYAEWEGERGDAGGLFGGATRTSVDFAKSTDGGASWSAPQSIVLDGTSVYPWIATAGSNLIVTLYHTDTEGLPGTVGSEAKWYESYVVSTNGGSSWTSLARADSSVATVGDICTEGVTCDSGREVGDFQSVAIDPTTGSAYAAYMRVPDPDHSLIYVVKLSFGSPRGARHGHR